MLTLAALLAQDEVTPSDPATLTWPLVAGGVAAIATTVVMVGGVLWRVWRHLRRSVLDPLGELIADWRGRPGEHGRPAQPGIPERLGMIERHVGNGTDRPLREIVLENATRVEKATEVSHRAQETAAAAQALAQQNAAGLAEHYVRGHGGGSGS